MDPYDIVIPDERGPELRKRERERDETDNEVPRIKRARADTQDMLLVESDIVTIDEPPKPEKQLADYNPDRLRQGLLYSHSAIKKRDITPRTKAFLEKYKETYKKALDGDPSDAKLATVQLIDDIYHSSSFILRPTEDSLQTKLILLRKLELFGDYGDYLGQTLQHLRADMKQAAKEDPDNSQINKAIKSFQRPRQWTDIADELCAPNSTIVKSNLAVACTVIGYDYDHMKWLIETWSERNRNFHSPVRNYIDDCQWTKLSHQLFLDLKELYNIIEDPEDRANYTTTLIGLRNLYFNVLVEDDPEAWIPNEEAQALTIKKAKIQANRERNA